MQVQSYKTTFNLQVFLKYFFEMEENNKRSDCPISGSLDIWGDKWSLLIVRDLMMKNQCTYGDFQRSDEGIATNILASRLKSLTENGIIEKLQHPKSKAKVLYQLTEKGIDLLPIMAEINIWMDKYYTIPLERKEVLKALKRDKEGFIKESKKTLKKMLITK